MHKRVASGNNYPVSNKNAFGAMWDTKASYIKVSVLIYIFLFFLSTFEQVSGLQVFLRPTSQGQKHTRFESFLL